MMKKLFVVIAALLLGLNIPAQDIRISEYISAYGSKVLNQVADLDEAGRNYQKFILFPEKTLIIDYTYKPEIGIAGEQYYTEYADSVVQGGFGVFHFQEDQITQKSYFDELGEKTKEMIYTIDGPSQTTIELWQKQEDREDTTSLVKFLVFDENTIIKKESIWLDSQLINTINYQHLSDKTIIASAPSHPEITYFQEVYHFEDNHLKAFERLWGKFDMKKLIVEARTQKTFQYNKKGLLRKMKMESYTSTEPKPFLTSFFEYEVKKPKNLDLALLEKINTAILKMALPEAWNYKEYGW